MESPCGWRFLKGLCVPSLVNKNGRVSAPASRHDAIADVWIEDRMIKGVGMKISAAQAEVFDASGLIVAPGFIDIHVHLREPGFEYAETIESGARAPPRAASPPSVRCRTPIP